MKLVNVKFFSKVDEEYSDGYIFQDKIGVKVDDVVLVDTQYGVSLAYVTEVDVKTVLNITKEIIEIIECKYYETIKREKRAKELKKEMKSKIKKLDELEMFEYYAERDGEFAKIFKEYNELC